MITLILIINIFFFIFALLFLQNKRFLKIALKNLVILLASLITLYNFNKFLCKVEYKMKL